VNDTISNLINVQVRSKARLIGCVSRLSKRQTYKQAPYESKNKHQQVQQIETFHQKEKKTKKKNMSAFNTKTTAEFNDCACTSSRANRQANAQKRAAKEAPTT
jgi:hypothetical protein